MKFGQLIEYNKRNIFLPKSCKNETVRLVSDFYFKKSSTWGKIKWSAAWFQYISISLKLGIQKNKFYKTLVYWSRDMHNSDFSEKGLGIVSLTHFVNDFFKKNVFHVIFQ